MSVAWTSRRLSVLKMNVTFIEHLLCGVWSIPGPRQGQVRKWSQPGECGRERIWGHSEVHVEDVISGSHSFPLGSREWHGPPRERCLLPPLLPSNKLFLTQAWTCRQLKSEPWETNSVPFTADKMDPCFGGCWKRMPYLRSPRLQIQHCCVSCRASKGSHAGENT